MHEVKQDYLFVAMVHNTDEAIRNHNIPIINLKFNQKKEHAELLIIKVFITIIIL